MAEAGRHDREREARRLALGAVFESDFGQRTAERALERRMGDEATDVRAATLARAIVVAVVRHRDSIDVTIERAAPAWPVVQLARIDRALLRCGIGELLHCPTPARVAISEWVELARTYSGEPSRRLMNGVLGRVVKDTTAPAETERNERAGGRQVGPSGKTDHEEGSPE
jgi:transcription antitermination protein NusB